MQLQLERIKLVIAGVWISSAAILGGLVGAATWQMWAALIAVAVLPPLALLLWWTEPAQTTSEAIQEARRNTWRS